MHKQHCSRGKIVSIKRTAILVAAITSTFSVGLSWSKPPDEQCVLESLSKGLLYSMVYGIADQRQMDIYKSSVVVHKPKLSVFLQEVAKYPVGLTFDAVWARSISYDCLGKKSTVKLDINTLNFCGTKHEAKLRQECIDQAIIKIGG